MIRRFLLAIAFSGSLMASSDFDQNQSARFARLALDCVHREYPNKIAHALNSDADVKPPRELTPAFYGCYDWHSSVHGHWLLVRLARLFPDAPFAAEARRALAVSLTAGNIAQEVKYLDDPGAAVSSGLTALRGCCNWRRNCGMARSAGTAMGRDTTAARTGRCRAGHGMAAETGTSHPHRRTQQHGVWDGVDAGLCTNRTGREVR